MNALLSFILFLGLSPNARACTAFCLVGDKSVLVGKSYDWVPGHGHGMVYVNLRGTSRVGLSIWNPQDPMKWTAKYGSLTFTQFGKGFPIGGMNEKGLVVEILTLVESKYNERDFHKPFVNQLQWVQFQLDNYSSTREVLENIHQLRIHQALMGVHFFVADSKGVTLTIDFISGVPVVHSGSTLPVRALSNDTYGRSLLTVTQPFSELENVGSSLQRFKIVSDKIKLSEGLSDKDLNTAAWDILASVQPENLKPETPNLVSLWHSVMDSRSGEIVWRTKDSPELKRINLADFDFSPNAQEMMLGLNHQESGDMRPKFIPYSAELNAKLIGKNRLLMNLAMRQIAIAAGYPPSPCATDLSSK